MHAHKRPFRYISAKIQRIVDVRTGDEVLSGVIYPEEKWKFLQCTAEESVIECLPLIDM